MAVLYPGKLSPDSSWQLHQAIMGQYNDWHPPLMAALWRLLLVFGDGPAPMLIFQVGLYWLGIWAVIDGSIGDRTCWRRLFILAAALHPLLLVLLGVVLKDVGMASALTAGFGLLYRQRQLGRSQTLPVVVAAVLLLVYGALVRVNAVFALPALLLYWARPQWLSATRLIPAAGLIASLAIIASGIVNYAILRAERSRVEATLQLYDLAGIATIAGGESGLKTPLGCYNNFHWDTLNEPRCGRLFDTLAAPGTAPLARWWVTEIGRHPLAYVQHRLEHFNSATYFLVAPAHYCRFEPDHLACQRPPRAVAINDFVKKNALCWPCIWLAAGIWLVFLRDLPSASRALAWSGIMYGFSFLIVGVATDYRYFFWTTLSVSIAAGIHLSGIANPMGAAKDLAVPVLLVACAGYAARLLYFGSVL